MLTHNLIRNNIAATVAGDYMGLGGGILIFYSISLLEDNTITGIIATTFSAREWLVSWIKHIKFIASEQIPAEFIR